MYLNQTWLFVIALKYLFLLQLVSCSLNNLSLHSSCEMKIQAD